MKTLLVRTASGAVYAASIILPFLFSEVAWTVVALIYAILVSKEVFDLSNKVWGSTILVRRVKNILIAIIWGVLPLVLVAFAPFYDFWPKREVSRNLMLSMFFLVWTFDTFAYLTGMVFGKRKLAPKISPKKTVEGYVGGVVFTIIVAWLISMRLVTSLPLWFWICGVFIVSVPGTMGDLAESWIKRRAGVKDSGKLMPGHGGFFDRFDSLLAVIPLWLLLTRIVFC